MKIKTLLSLLIVFSVASYGQNVGIGTSSPAALLDIYSTSDGVLIPRVALTGTGSASPLTSPTESTLVYNTATAGSGAAAVSPGFYYWNGSAWIHLIDNGSLTGSTTVSNTSSANTISTTVNGVTGSTVPIINTNTLGLSGTTLTSTINGLASGGLDLSSLDNNIYNSDGTLTGNRTVTMSGNVLDFAGGKVGISTTAPLNLFNIQPTGNASPGSSGTYAFGVNSAGGYDDITIGSDANYTYFQSWESKPLQINSQGNNVLIPVGNVGIGTTTPGSMLTVNGTTTTTNFQMTNGSNANYVLQSDASGNARWVSPSSIGTTNSLSLSTNTLTSTVNGVAVTSAAVSGVSNTSSANTISTTVNGVTGGTVPIINSNTLGLSGTTLTSTINGFASTGLNLSSLDNNIYNSDGTLTGARTVTMSGNTLNFTGGNVGIGQSTPAYKLDINGSANINGSLYLYNNNNTTTNKLFLSGTDANHYIYSTGSGGNSMYLGEYGGVFHFYNTASASDVLFINGTTINVPGLSASTEVYTDGSKNLTSTAPTSGQLGYWTRSGTDLYNTNQSDYVGIGTTAPGAKLDVNGAICNERNWLYLAGPGDLNHAVGNLLSYNGNDAEQFRYCQYLEFVSGCYGVTAVHINGTNGYVGIGTTSPSNTLDVQGGNIDASGYIQAGGTGGGAILFSGTTAQNGGAAGGGCSYYGRPRIGDWGNWLTIGEPNGTNGGMILQIQGGAIYTGTSTGITAGPTLRNCLDNGSGWVGIGTTSPGAALDVEYANYSFNEGGYKYLAGGGTGGSSCGSCNVSIYTPNRMEAAEFDANSDRRIKKDITSLPAAISLEEANKLKVVTFRYIDQLSKGNKNKTGFIAQEVETVLPNAVNQDEGYIPNVFEVASKSEIRDRTLTVTTFKDHDFAAGDQIRIYDKDNKANDVIVAKVLSANEFEVSGWTSSSDSLFIYGKKVSDYRNVDYDQITAVAIGAIQELNKKVNEEQKNNKSLEEKISKLEQQNSDSKSDIDKLKASVGTLQQIIESRAQK